MSLTGGIHLSEFDGLALETDMANEALSLVQTKLDVISVAPPNPRTAGKTSVRSSSFLLKRNAIYCAMRVTIAVPCTLRKWLPMKVKIFFVSTWFPRVTMSGMGGEV